MTPGWLDQVSIADVVLALGGVAAVAFVARFMLVHVHPLMLRLIRVLDLILGRPKQGGIPAAPSMIDRFDALDARLTAQDVAIAEVKQQVTPNHGSTSKLAEDVQAIAAQLAALVDRFEDHIHKN